MDIILRCTFITFFRYVDELDHVAMVESGSSDNDNTITQGGCLCTVGTGQYMYTVQLPTEERFIETITLL